MDAPTISAIAATISALTSLGLALMTARYVRLTSHMVAEMRSVRQPLVFVDIVIHDLSEITLIIGNSGDAPGRHIKFDVDDRIPWSGKPAFYPTALPALRDGIPYLAPGRSLRFLLGSIEWKEIQKQRGWINLQITYAGEGGKKYEQTANLDLRRYDGIRVDTFDRPEEQAAGSLRDMLWLAREIDMRDRPTSTTRWCHACARPMPYSAKKCAQCGEWVPEARDSNSDESAT